MHQEGPRRSRQIRTGPRQRASLGPIPVLTQRNHPAPELALIFGHEFILRIQFDQPSRVETSNAPA